MSDTRASASKPTIVLVHGAFAESSSWSGVITALRGQGFPVIALANPLRGVPTDCDYLRATLAGLDGDVVLVGHSYGGMVISGGATGNPNVKALVYIGAFAPDEGDTAGGLSGRFPGSTLADTLIPVALADGRVDLYIDQEKYHQQFAADSSAEIATVMAATQRPILQSAFDEPASVPAWKSVPSWFLFGALDRNIPAEAHRFMADRAGSRRTVELPGGSHTVGIPEADRVVELIREAVDATVDGHSIS